VPMTQKKILIFNWRDIKHREAGGAERYIYEIFKRLARMGHTIVWFSGNDGESLYRENIDGISVIRKGSRYTVFMWAFLYYWFSFRRQHFDFIVESQNAIPF